MGIGVKPALALDSASPSTILKYQQAYLIDRLVRSTWLLRCF